MKAPRRNIYKPPPRLIVMVEYAFGSTLAFYLYTFLYILQRSKFAFLLGFSRKLSSQEKVFRKYHDIGYKYYFQKADLKKAYKFRIEYVCAMEMNGDPLSKFLASNYLNIVNSRSTIALIDLSADAREYLFAREQNLQLLNKNKSDVLPKIDNLLLFGPAADPESIDFHIYSHLCFTKPVPIEKYGVPASKTILVLNNIWSIHKKNIVISWAEANPEATIFSPNRLDVTNENNKAFELIPKFPFRSSPMGLQRALTILLNQYHISKINVQGFDFSLSDDPYKPWYPSLRSGEGFRNVTQAVLHSNMNHDFLLNYLYTKLINELHPEVITGSLDPHLNDTTEHILTKFENKVNSRYV